MISTSLSEHIKQDASQLESFADRIEALVNIAGSNSEFARLCGVSESVVRKWRRGESDPSREHLITIAKAFNVNLLWLATGEGPMKKGDFDLTTVTITESPVNSGFCFLPLYDVSKLANLEALKDNTQASEQFPYKQSWLQELGVTPEQCCLIYVDGDAMSPTLNDRDIVIVSRTRLLVRDSIYCFLMDGVLMIKRIQRVQKRKFKVISDNPAYEPFLLDDNFRTEDMIGRMVGVLKRF